MFETCEWLQIPRLTSAIMAPTARPPVLAPTPSAWPLTVKVAETSMSLLTFIFEEFPMWASTLGLISTKAKFVVKAPINDYVFTTPKAFYWGCGKWFPRLVKKAGIDPCTLRNLRRTCSTLIQEAGFSRETAMQVLGQTSAQVNMDYYTGVLIRQQRIAIDSLPSIG